MLAAVIAVPALTHHPVVSYAASGSMEPTIGTFDVFLVDPFPLRVDVGDIIVFESVTKGGPAVHRAVSNDGAGWYTQGDANPDADQIAGEPVVGKDRILGKVMTWPGGSPIVVRKMAIPLVEARERLAATEEEVGGPAQMRVYVLLGLAALLGALALFTKEKLRPRRRMPARRERALRRLLPRGILAGHVAILVIAMTLVAGIAAARQSRSEITNNIIVVEDAGAADGTRAAAPGGSVHATLDLPSLGPLPTLAIVRPSPDIHVERTILHVEPMRHATLGFDQTARAQSGVQSDTLEVRRYPALLPEGAIVALDAALPGSPDLVLAGALALADLAWVAAAGFATLPVGRRFGVQEDWR